jgi:hypothetical protein
VSAEYRCAPPAKVPRVCRACWGKSNSRPQCRCLRTLIAADETAGPARSRNRNSHAAGDHAQRLAREATTQRRMPGNWIRCPSLALRDVRSWRSS